ncbi:hypothetical protein CBS115989_10927 [Aspergillus niger]|uniref:Uncharacterized protein n=2 Tax=Aspergillus niger TaxID=5061 RepID=G3Y5J6_ASPNA|nr:hypothetical protein ASPNIDRAFT_41216 [Aspergillus niger ATCC 1015]KAI2811963.1 hypothetical protein CBS115989_10927 [Aspergillus niger]KAI2834024.1 hypothetical protein CBS11350_11026 [Aspergillus niger]KAI2834154.1 hypothetical protein CBS11232_10898 [Aspergillus niger]KAI2836284.1 hypothetical protein CBS12448_11089 [Aspergillus niger]
MAYSPSDDVSQYQPANLWTSTPEYAPTPGYFGRTSESSCSSPEYVPDDHCSTHQQPQAEQLEFLPFADWEEERVYNEQPPVYIHYRIDWKVTLNGKSIAQITEPDLVVRPSEFWQNSLKDAAERFKNRKVDHTRRVRMDDITVVASVKDRTQQDLRQQDESTKIKWAVIEKQLLMWSNLFRLGKQIKLQVSINYTEDSNAALLRSGEKRAATSVTKRMLAERDAQIDGENVSGQASAWRDVFRKIRCPGPPCRNRNGYCWQDPVGKKHYRLLTHHVKRLARLVERGHTFDTHDDMPIEIRDELYAEDQQWQERQHKMTKTPQSQGSGLPININFLPHSPQPPALATPADTPPTLPHSNPDMVDTLLIPDLPLDTAVKEYSCWQQSRVDSHALKDDIEKACDLALTNGLDLRQIHEDKNPEFFINNGVKVGVARRFVNDIREWLEQL